MEHPNNNTLVNFLQREECPSLQVNKIGQMTIKVGSILLSEMLSQSINSTISFRFFSRSKKIDILLVTRRTEDVYDIVHKRSDDNRTICLLTITRDGRGETFEVVKLVGTNYEF